MSSEQSTMYLPGAFAVTDQAIQHDFIERYPFATLITSVADSAQAKIHTPRITHVPLLLDRNRGPHGTLVGHLARANPHWRLFAEATEQASAVEVPSIAIFHGPHAYISSAWYDPPAAVPTWNYAAIHASGVARIINDQKVTAQILTRTVAQFEDDSNAPLPTLEKETHDNLVRAVVAFELPVAQIEAKFKLGQNRSRNDQLAMTAILRARGQNKLADLIESQQ